MNAPQGTENVPFRADRLRLEYHGRTGIYVRAKTADGKWMNADIAELERESVVRFLRSRGDASAWAVNTVLMLIGHNQLEPSSQTPGVS